MEWTELIWSIVLETLICASGLESNLLWKASGTGRGLEPSIRLSQAIYFQNQLISLLSSKLVTRNSLAN